MQANPNYFNSMGYNCASWLSQNEAPALYGLESNSGCVGSGAESAARATLHKSN